MSPIPRLLVPPRQPMSHGCFLKKRTLSHVGFAYVVIQSLGTRGQAHEDCAMLLDAQVPQQVDVTLTTVPLDFVQPNKRHSLSVVCPPHLADVVQRSCQNLPDLVRLPATMVSRTALAGHAPAHDPYLVRCPVSAVKGTSRCRVSFVEHSSVPIYLVGFQSTHVIGWVTATWSATSMWAVERSAGLSGYTSPDSAAYCSLYLEIMAKVHLCSGRLTKS